MENFIVVLILIAILAGNICYFFRLKKSGKISCVGCPYANRCGTRYGGVCSNINTNDNKEA